MTPALVGFLGVVAGGFLGGGMQWAIARLDRRLAARTSARLLFMSLSAARDAMRGTVELGWNPVVDWDSFNAAWVENSRDLARVLGTHDFLIVSSTFTGIAQIGQIRAHDLRDSPPGANAALSTNGAEQIAVYNAHVQRALQIVLGASFSRREKRRRQDESGLAFIEAMPAIKRGGEE
jgi:hypothetical protein